MKIAKSVHGIANITQQYTTSRMLSTSLASLEFKQHELTLTGTNNRGCLAVYPQGKKARQRVAAGDSSGSVHVFTMGKHHDVKTDFLTSAMPKPLDRLTLFEDQLFMIHGASISAYTKKGKPFFSFETNLTEAIKVFKIHTPFIFAGGEYTFTTFRETEEVGFFMPPDKVNDMVFTVRGGDAASSGEPKLDDFDCYLACNDRVLRSVNSCKVLAEAGCEAPLSALTIAVAPHDSKKRDIVYGTHAGTFGAFTVNSNNDLVRRYSSIPNQRLPSYTCMTSCDINQDGVPDILLAREDGTVEAHTFSRDSTSDEPNKVWSASVGEYVNSIASGMITNVETEEILIHTYAGKIISFSLCPEDAAVGQQKVVVPSVLQSKAQELPSAQQQIKRNASVTLGPTVSGSFVQDPTSAVFVPSSIEITHAKVRETQDEIEKLRRQVEEKTRAYAAVTGATETGSLIKAVVSEFRVRESLTHDATSDVLRLVIEADCALQHVALRCDRQLEIIQDSSRSPNILVSIAGSNGKSMNVQPTSLGTSSDLNSSQNSSSIEEGPFYALVRSTDEASTNVSVSFRTHEGEAATIQIYVLPRASPRTAQLRLISIKPLALHHRVGEGDVPLGEIPLSTIRISGTFSIKDAHSWALKCLPDVPDMIGSAGSNNNSATNGASSDSTMSLFFKNEFHHTFLSLKYAKGDIECKSDNLSALAIFKDHVTREATLRKIPVKIQSEPQEESVVRHLKLLDPLLSKQLQLAHRAKLVEALKEIEAQESDTSFLTEEYREVLACATMLEQDQKLQPARVEYLRRCYHKLFADRAGFYGKGVTERLHRQLSQLLEDYSLGAMLDFFQREK